MLEEGPVFGSAPAALASLLFDPPEPQIIGKTEKHSVSRLSYLFAHLHLLSSDSFSSTLLSSNLSLLSDPFHLCFSSVHIVGSLTSKLPSTKLAQTRCSTTEYHKTCTNTFQYYRILQSLHKHVPVLPYTTKLAERCSSTTVYYKNLAQTRSSTTVYYKAPTNTFQYCRILQSLHKHIPSTTVYYKVRTNTFQYYRILQSLHKVVPSTTVYYKTCTNTFQYYRILESLHKHVPVLPYTTKLAQTRSSTTVYYKACTNVPVLPYTTKLAQTRSSTTVYYKVRTNTFQYYVCSFPYRHGDVCAAKRTSFCSFPNE